MIIDEIFPQTSIHRDKKIRQLIMYPGRYQIQVLEAVEI